MPPPQPKPRVHRLPPMLRMTCRRPMAGYSKGARGLFVLSRVIGILTDTTISPSLRRRQWPSRYAIRAGRNLPDKEFRYSYGRRLPGRQFRASIPKDLTLPFNLPAPGRRQCLYVSLIALADTCVFAKQSLGPILCGQSPLMTRSQSRTAGTPYPEVTGSFCRVPSP